jgi:hypothetical protein
MIQTRSLHVRNALVFTVLLAGSLLVGAGFALSVALGGALQMLNLGLLHKSVAWMLGSAGAGQSRPVQALIALRFVAVMATCIAILVTLPVDPLGFTLGFSSVVPAAVWHGLATATSES